MELTSLGTNNFTNVGTAVDSVKIRYYYKTGDATVAQENLDKIKNGITSDKLDSSIVLA